MRENNCDKPENFGLPWKPSPLGILRGVGLAAGTAAGSLLPWFRLVWGPVAQRCADLGLSTRNCLGTSGGAPARQSISVLPFWPSGLHESLREREAFVRASGGFQNGPLAGGTWLCVLQQLTGQWPGEWAELVQTSPAFLCPETCLKLSPGRGGNRGSGPGRGGGGLLPLGLRGCSCGDD